MLLLVSGATATVRRYAHTCLLGHLLTPGGWNTESIDTALPWAIDNGAFSGFDVADFSRCLNYWRRAPGCRFVCCPDVVSDATRTREQFGQWGGVIRAAGYPVAYVGQDGQDGLPVPWDDLDAWFVGGSTRWKLSAGSAELCREAKRRGKWVHVGRVNTRRRLRWAYDAGADSIDGSGFSQWPDIRIPLGIRWIRELEEQGTLF